MRCDAAQLPATQHAGSLAMSIQAVGGSRGGGGGADPTQAPALPRTPPAAANKARLAEIGLVQTVQAIASTQTEQTRARRAAKAATRAARKAAGAAPTGRVRRCCAAPHCYFQPLFSPCWLCCGVCGRLLVLAARRHRGDCWHGSAAVGGLGRDLPTACCPGCHRPPHGCRSERVAGLDAPNYNENARLLSLADPEGPGSRDRRLMRGALGSWF